MKTTTISSATIPLRRFTVTAVSVLSLVGPVVRAQTSSAAPGTAHQGMPQPSPQASLQRQIDMLKAEIAELKAAVERLAPANASGRVMSKGTGMSGGAMGAAATPMRMDKGEMGRPPEGMRMMGEGMGSMSKMGGGRMMEMEGMGEMGMKRSGMKGGMKAGGAADTAMAMSNAPSAAKPSPETTASLSSVPGIPGESHLYHIGSTGFFLDQTGIQLTSDQQAALNRIKQRALTERSQAERRAEQAEEELWILTSATQPDAVQVTAKVREIERIRADARLSFVTAVGDATKVLTNTQQAALLGSKLPSK